MAFCGSGEVWKQLRRLSNARGVKKAAVAFVSSDSIIKFGAGDLLIVDASDPVVLAGLTSASALSRAFSRGARIVSVAGLHAKVLIFDKTLAVGSANISMNSCNRLIESLMICSERNSVRHATQWIEGLASTGVSVNALLLKHLLSIEATRPPMRSAFRKLSEAHIVFFKEVKQGDVEKYETHSSTAGTGGGARDLRVSPISVFQGVLSQMFSEATTQRGVSCGKVLSRTKALGVQETVVELWRPTPSRPSELRISRFYDVPGWKITLSHFNQNQRAGKKLFYVLEMDVHGTITAKVMTDSALTASDNVIQALIGRIVSSNSGQRSIIGAVDLVSGASFPATV